MQRLQENPLEPIGAQLIAADNNAGLNNAIMSPFEQLTEYQKGKRDEPTYVLTLSEDPSWTLGNPTGISTRIAATTTETYLFFTRTTLIWQADAASFFTSNSDTPITTLPVATIHTTLTVTGDDEPTETASTSEITATAALSITLDTFSTETVSSTNTGSSIAATGTESALPDERTELPQSAVIGISVGVSVFFFGLVLAILIWTIRQKKRDKIRAEASLPRARTWEPMNETHHQASGPAKPVRYHVPDMPSMGRRGPDYDYGHDHPARAYHDHMAQQAQQQAQQAGMTPPPVSPYHQQGEQAMGAYQPPAQQAQQPDYRAYHPSMGHVGQQGFAVELASENYRS
ncbi:hypothetical protein F5X68DRAFT_237481 [Plectosphaerella plurivora]|uniref:Mid2 domain-containing protein n=1 Tax=Plectosphaerella plurivora TaxID=936078 RepID=A0A9P8V0N7_9PEZI|nr:hypothetical protein F5X68DRAFT_237481 [Plectosphaerella plurivora]